MGLAVAGILYKMFPEQFADGDCWFIRKQCIGFQLYFGLIIFAPILLFSLITYKIKQEVFKVWAWFSLVFAVLYIYISVTETGPRDVFSPSMIRGTIFIFILYSILSIIAISIQLFHTRKKN